MWKKIFKTVFYVLLALTLLLVVGAAVVCVIYAAAENRAEFYLFAALTFVIGVILTFISFAFLGMVIEMMDNIEDIKKKLAEITAGKKPEAETPVIPAPVQSENADAVSKEPLQAAEETVSGEEKPESWICPTCGSVNPGQDLFCTTCGTKKH